MVWWVGSPVYSFFKKSELRSPSSPLSYASARCLNRGGFSKTFISTLTRAHAHSHKAGSVEVEWLLVDKGSAVVDRTRDEC